MSASRIGLAGTRDYPLIGELPARPRLAVVGSRAVRRDIAEAVRHAVRQCADEGWSLVSGGALGVDGIAHAHALELELPQVAVLPCGPDRRYPERHRSLFARMSSSSHAALLFALESGSTTARAVFASRNRLVIGLADAVLVAQAALPSGSYGTGKLAARRRLPLAVFPGSSGCAALAAAGASVLASLEARACSTAAWLRASAQGRSVPDEEVVWPEHLRWLRAALDASGARGCSIDELPDPMAGLCLLAEAESLGLVCEIASGRFVAARALVVTTSTP